MAEEHNNNENLILSRILILINFDELLLDLMTSATCCSTKSRKYLEILNLIVSHPSILKQLNINYKFNLYHKKLITTIKSSLDFTFKELSLTILTTLAKSKFHI